MLGKISALWRSEPENVDSPSNCAPFARATDPTRLDVSTAKMRGLDVILRIFPQSLNSDFSTLSTVVLFASPKFEVIVT